MTSPSPVVLAELIRNGFVEGEHYGHAVIVDPDGSIVAAWGDPNALIFPRSSNKPAQAVAMVRNGVDLPPDLLALACASHSGEAMHLEAARQILARAGLDESALQTPADYPLDGIERDEWIGAHRECTPIAMNCSGKHSAMLLTCVVNEWDTATYLDPEHPLQVAITTTVGELAGEPIEHMGVDGCGAPLLSLTLAGLARSVSAIATSDDTVRVADAMRTHPELVGGSRRPVTELMRAVPGLIAKDGAEGVQVLALPNGRAAAVKVLDGSDRARIVTSVALLDLMSRGAQVDERLLIPQRTLPVLGGGREVGEVRSVLR